MAAIAGRQFVVGAVMALSLAFTAPGVILRRCMKLSCFQGGSEGTLVVVFLLGGCFMFVPRMEYKSGAIAVSLAIAPFHASRLYYNGRNYWFHNIVYI